MNILIQQNQPLPELYALRAPRYRRSLTEAEITLTRPFFISGQGSSAEHGVLFLHGLSGTPAPFHCFISPLSSLGYTLFAPCLSGHGSKPEDLLMTTWRSWYQSATEALQELQRHCKQITIIGSSLGGALALQLSAQQDQPTIQQLFLLAPAVFPNFPLRLLVNHLGRLLQSLGIQFLPAIGGDIKKPEGADITYRKIPIQALLELYTCMQVTQQILPRVKTATTIYHSRQDHRVTSKSIRQLLSALPSSQKEVIWLHHSYHAILVDNDAQSVIDDVMMRIQLKQKKL